VVSPGARCPAVHFRSLKHTQKISGAAGLFSCSAAGAWRSSCAGFGLQQLCWHAGNIAIALNALRQFVLLFGAQNLATLPHLLMLPLPLLSVCCS
jgi:hypothetical protein